MKRKSSCMPYTASLLCAVFVANVSAREMPREYADVLKTLDKKGDFKDNVIKVNIPSVRLRRLVCHE
jgi:hypothetical protein